MARIDAFLKLGLAQGCSDVHLAVGVPPMLRVHGDLMPIKFRDLGEVELEGYVAEILTPAQKERFGAGQDVDFSYVTEDGGRFRVNVYRKETGVGATFRFIPGDIPRLDKLRLPKVIQSLCDHHQGMILVTGSTGAGKSTTLAAMIDYRNSNRTGHILTIEDPIEYLYEHRRSIVNQREIGIDTQNYQLALQNALREAPDLIMIGEIRDKETMQSALLHTLTGHLCLSTIHANNSYHALSRIINLFPYEARSAVLSDLSIGLRAIVSQRLIRNVNGELQPGVEILMNTSLIAELIKNGEFSQIKEAMEQSLYPGSQTFEQSLCRLHLDGAISYDEAMAASDSPTNLAWLINQSSPSARVENLETSVADREQRRPAADFATLTIDPAMLERQQQH